MFKILNPTFRFSPKEEFKKAVESFGEPPCLECLIQASCCDKIETSHSYDFIVNDVCKEMLHWAHEIKN